MRPSYYTQDFKFNDEDHEAIWEYYPATRYEPAEWTLVMVDYEEIEKVDSELWSAAENSFCFMSMEIGIRGYYD